MADWEVRLFGKPIIQCYGKAWSGPENNHAQEIFLYLLSHRRAVHSRESLACLLWGDSPTDQSRKQLRQTLWRLRSCDSLPAEMKCDFLLSIDKEYIQINPAIECSVDTEVFEQAYNQIKGRSAIDATLAEPLREAVQLYRGGFLENYWQDWCIYERERLQNMYLAMLDKLVEWCLVQKRFEEGFEYTERILRLDPASERAHQQIMRLHHYSGNRTAALRQFERCVKALKDELGVEPAKKTLMLFEQIRADRLDSGSYPTFQTDSQSSFSLSDLLAHLKQSHSKLAELQKEIQRDIQLVEYCLPRRRTQH